MVTQDDFTNFEGQEEVEIASRPQVKLYSEGDKFIGYLAAVSDNPLAVAEDNGMGGESWGNKVFTFVAIGTQSVDHRSSDGSASGKPAENPITEGESYNFFTNYTKKGILNVNGIKLSALPLGAIVKLENIGRKKAEGSKYFYKDISIIAKKGPDGKFVTHPDYKPLDNFDNQEELSVDDIPFK